MVDIKADLWPPWTPRRDQLLRGAHDHLSDADYDAAVAAGRDWPFEQAATGTVAALARISPADVPSQREGPRASAAAPTGEAIR